MIPAGWTEFAALVLTRPSRTEWLVLALPSGVDPRQAARQLAADLSALSATPVATSEPASAQDLVRTVREASESITVFGPLDHFSEKQWSELDFHRTRLQDRRGILVMSQTSAGSLINHAPNLASWLTGSIYLLDPSVELLSTDEKEKRLAALRAHHALTDERVLELGSRGELPPEPDFAEWVVLLGRADLLD